MKGGDRIIAAILIIAATLVFLGVRKSEERKQVCRDSGGEVLSTRGNFYCLKAGSIIINER